MLEALQASHAIVAARMTNFRSADARALFSERWLETSSCCSMQPCGRAFGRNAGTEVSGLIDVLSDCFFIYQAQRHTPSVLAVVERRGFLC